MIRSRRKKRTRRGATAVEFAMVAPIFFLTVFACVEFGKFWIAETFVESAVFQTARDLSVFGAKVEEGEPFAAMVLARYGIEEFEIEITPLRQTAEGDSNNDEDVEINLTAQDQITDSTSRIRVTIDVPASEVSILNGWLAKSPIIRTAESLTNRPQ